MVSLMTGLWQLIIPMIVLSCFSASLPSRERTETHTDGLFHSELSKMHDNAYVQQVVKHLVDLKERFQRHSDGLFTSEYSKMRGNAQVQKFIQNLMGRKRRAEVTVSKLTEHDHMTMEQAIGSSPGPVKADVLGREEENSHEGLCFMWLYQSFLNANCSDSDAREAAEVTSQYICPISKQLIAEMKEVADSFDQR